MSFIHIKGIGPEIWKFVKQVNGISSGNMETFTMMSDMILKILCLWHDHDGTSKISCLLYNMA